MALWGGANLVVVSQLQAPTQRSADPNEGVALRFVVYVVEEVLGSVVLRYPTGDRICTSP